jgi:eukaryotic-like serine/threonine-protein kinase
MRYPSPEDYLKAVQRPESFTTDELRNAELVVHPVFRIPMPASGTSAVVFKALVGGEPQALRFFTREDDWSADRYDALHSHFLGSDLEDIVAMPRWVPDGIEVNGRTWPVVRMQWVEGHTLNKHVESLVAGEDTAALGALADHWLDLVVALQREEFAHGDLQHGNVMVDEQGTIRLVDFDGSWIARFAGLPAPSETGHQNYQPRTRTWGRWMDTFSGLLIYTSLRALARNPAPWHTLNTGENMLFRREDFQQPHDTATWTHLADLGDRQVDDLSRRLIECCEPGWTASSALDELLDESRRPTATRSYSTGTKQWWELASSGTPVASVSAEPQPQASEPQPSEPQASQPRATRTPRPYGPARQTGTAGRAPWPAPADGRPPTAPRGPRPPGSAWWQEKSGQAPARSRPPSGVLFAIAAVAVLLSIVTAALVLGADDDLGPLAALVALATATVTVLAGYRLARRR